MTTPRLNIPEIAESQASKFLTHNQAIRLLEILQVGVKSRTTTAQASSPAEGDSYILPANPTGTVWGTYDEHDIAYYINGAWARINPVEGTGPLWVEDDQQWAAYTGGAWAEFGSGAGCSCIRITLDDPPSNALGRDDDYAHNPTAGKWWRRKAGVWDTDLNPVVQGWSYFRLRITASNNADRTGIGEIEVRDGGGVDLTQPTTTIDSGSAVNVAGRGPEQAIDNNNTGFDGWLTETGGAHPFELTVQLDAPITDPSGFSGYSIQNRQNDANFYPTDWAARVSVDGVHYYDIDTQTGQVFTANEQKVIAATIPSLQGQAISTTEVRILITSAGGAVNGSIAEWQIRETIGGANVITNATIDASSNHPSHPPANIVDGNLTTKWASADSTFPAWVRAVFPSAINLAEVIVTAPDVPNNEDPRNWAIQYWNGAAFVDFYTNASEPAWAASEHRGFI